MLACWGGHPVPCLLFCALLLCTLQSSASQSILTSSSGSSLDTSGPGSDSLPPSRRLANNIQLRKLARLVLPYVHQAANQRRNEEESDAATPGDILRSLQQRPDRQRLTYSRKTGDGRRKSVVPGSEGQQEGDVELVPADVGLQDFEDFEGDQDQQKRVSFEEYGHMRFGRSQPVVKKYDDYGHMRFGK